MPKFKKQLRTWRGERAQPAAASALGVNLKTYRNWEQGRNIPSGFALSKILEIIASPNRIARHSNEKLTQDARP